MAYHHYIISFKKRVEARVAFLNADIPTCLQEKKLIHIKILNSLNFEGRRVFVFLFFLVWKKKKKTKNITVDIISSAESEWDSFTTQTWKEEEKAHS